MADEKDMRAICKNCGETFHKNELDSDSKRPYCSRCMVELAEQYVPETSDMSKLTRIRKSKVGMTLLWITLLVCISIIAIQVPKLISAFTKESLSDMEHTQQMPRLTNASIISGAYPKCFKKGSCLGKI